MVCTTCQQDKPLHGKSGLCGNCYGKQLLASKTPEDQAKMKEAHRLTNSRWVQNNPEKARDATRKWLAAHPEVKKERLVKWKGTEPTRILRTAGIDTPFMREQLEEHRKNKRNRPPTKELIAKIESGMRLMI
jgi:hypothetical protein